MKTLIEVHYLPSISYFAALWGSSEIVLEKYERYVKQTYRNRCFINTSQGTAQLSVPVQLGHGKTTITDVRIDYSQKWLNNHWRTLRTAYGNAPFYEYYADDLEKILYKRFDFLYDLNYQLLSMCLKWLRWDISVAETMAYHASPDGSMRDRRCLINTRKTDLLSTFYHPVPYTQVFGNTFAENLSVIDLVFCKGPQALHSVQASAVEK